MGVVTIAVIRVPVPSAAMAVGVAMAAVRLMPEPAGRHGRKAKST
jgi:hypothetical protein